MTEKDWCPVETHPVPADIPVLVFYNKKDSSGFSCITLGNKWFPDSINVLGVRGYDYWNEFELNDITHWRVLESPLPSFYDNRNIPEMSASFGILEK